MTGTVFSIEEFSTFDGPGIRTTVFLKGCPLRCSWCHNPEGQRFWPETARNINACVECGLCANGAREEHIPACPANALRLCGISYTPEELVEKLMKNARILRDAGGGVTFSGGEPLAQPAFLLECLRILKGSLHRALQTSGYGAEDLFCDILGELDYVLFDLKIIDETAFRRWTGVSNKIILTNLAALCKSGVPFRIRVPLIPGVTDSEENIRGIAAAMYAHNAAHVELMPYNPMAGGKYKMAGLEYTPGFDEKVQVRCNADIFKQYGIHVKIL